MNIITVVAAHNGQQSQLFEVDANVLDVLAAVTHSMRTRQMVGPISARVLNIAGDVDWSVGGFHPDSVAYVFAVDEELAR